MHIWLSCNCRQGWLRASEPQDVKRVVDKGIVLAKVCAFSEDAALLCGEAGERKRDRRGLLLKPLLEEGWQP